MIYQQLSHASHEQQPPESLSVTVLTTLCACENNKFLRKEASDDRYGMELFRRAIIDRDEIAWSCLYQLYAPLVLTWISHQHSATFLFEQDSYASLVNATFAKFAQAITAVKLLNFHQLSTLLKYLKLCVHSVVTDEMRSQQTKCNEASLDEVEHEPRSGDPAEDVVSNLSAQGLWEMIQGELHGEDERTLILASISGYKPAEIWDQHRLLFPTIEDVYRVKRNVHERMRRNRHLKAMCHH